MEAYRVEKRILANGMLHLEALPFQEGEVVEVIILASRTSTSGSVASGLQGKVIDYREPTMPVAPDEWESLR